MSKDTRPLMVTIRCLCYNHEPYIRQCLEGFVMQKTNFRFEAVVHDDASTDGSADIIREYAEKYPDIIKPIFETENQYSKHDGSLKKIMDENMHGKYIAICEGDDYWIDPQKLQKQVDYFEKNPQCGLVYTNACMMIDGKVKRKRTISTGKCDFMSLLFYNDIATLTVMYRSGIDKKYRKEVNPQNWLMGDYPLWLFLSVYSKFKYIDEVTSVYRVLQESASHSVNNEKNLKFQNSVYDIRDFFAEKYIKVGHYKQKVKEKLRENRIVDIFYIKLRNEKMTAYKYLYYNRKDISTIRMIKTIIKSLVIC